MQIVADHLKSHALNTTDGSERDLFGRSAYNRYYYAAFLIIRAGFFRMEELGESEELPHSNVPERLRNRLRKKFNAEKRKALAVQDHDLARRCSHAASAAENLGAMMEEARATRTLADYFPEIPVEVSARGLSLMEVELESAKAWPQKAAAFMSTIESVWRQIRS
ncbi:hypothetical protein [Azotobacter beijerinckii]|uniref:hypothetical protein n=1 Tax=Azotobacter beijerinckii TaxID=170623 RepID=UPI0011133408|nr:hypothetical protein [Azotobacter beijerinckii]